MTTTAIYTLTSRERRRERARSFPCVLVEADSGDVLSQHPTMESAVAEARRIHGVRSMRGLPQLATEILPRRGQR